MIKYNEQLLCDRFLKMTRDGTTNRIVTGLYANIINDVGEVAIAKVSNSISVFIACRSVQSIVNLLTMKDSGQIGRASCRERV